MQLPVVACGCGISHDKLGTACENKPVSILYENIPMQNQPLPPPPRGLGGGSKPQMPTWEIASDLEVQRLLSYNNMQLPTQIQTPRPLPRHCCLHKAPHKQRPVSRPPLPLAAAAWKSWSVLPLMAGVSRRGQQTNRGHKKATSMKAPTIETKGERGTKSELATSPLPSRGPKRGWHCYVTHAFSGVPNRRGTKSNKTEHKPRALKKQESPAENLVTAVSSGTDILLSPTKLHPLPPAPPTLHSPHICTP